MKFVYHYLKLEQHFKMKIIWAVYVYREYRLNNLTARGGNQYKYNIYFFFTIINVTKNI